MMAEQRTRVRRDRVLRKAWRKLFRGYPPTDVGEDPPPWFSLALDAAAYHGAGHVAAYAFFDSAWPRVLYATILPHREFACFVRTDDMRQLPTPPGLATAPLFCWQDRLRAMVTDIAGGVASAQPTKQPFDQWTWLASNGNPNVEIEPGLETTPASASNDDTDAAKVWDSAEQIAGVTWPADRVVRMAVSLTVELMTIPEVWRCVCDVAVRLRAEGTLGVGDLEPLSAPIRGMVERLPKWRRRFVEFVRVSNAWKAECPALQKCA